MASSGRRGTLEAPPSYRRTGWNSGSVNPGQPNLQEMEELKRWNVSLPQCNTALFRGTRCSANPGPLATSPLQPVLLTKLFSCDYSLGLVCQKPLSTQGLQGTRHSRLSYFPQELLSEAYSATGCQPCTPSLPGSVGALGRVSCSCLCPSTSRIPPDQAGPPQKVTPVPPPVPRRLKSNPIISLDLRSTLIPTQKQSSAFICKRKAQIPHHGQ